MISFTMEGTEYRVYDHIFAVSRCGKVLRQMKPYVPTPHTAGYLALGRRRLMHRVMAACWLDNFSPEKHVHHKNGVKTDNRADNLECVSPKEHFGDKHKGLFGHYERTNETREKLRQYRLGRTDSENTRAKKRVILANVHPRRACHFKGVLYPSVSAAARAAGIPVATFRLRCKSKNFSDYSLG